MDGGFSRRPYRGVREKREGLKSARWKSTRESVKVNQNALFFIAFFFLFTPSLSPFVPGRADVDSLSPTNEWKTRGIFKSLFSKLLFRPSVSLSPHAFASFSVRFLSEVRLADTCARGSIVFQGNRADKRRPRKITPFTFNYLKLFPRRRTRSIAVSNEIWTRGGLV